MVSFNINVNLDLLREKCNKLKQIAEQLRNEVSSVMQNVNNVNTGWTGTNSDAYVEAFNEFKPKMDRKVEAIEATVAAIEQTIQAIAVAQQEIRTKAQSLPQ